jgi:hypothetical protein
VKEFVSDSAANLEPYGLHQPFLTLAWDRSSPTAAAALPDAASAKLFSAEPFIGTNTALLFGQDTEGNVFAKYETEPFVFRVGASVLNGVPRDAARWNSLTPVRFSQFALLQIRISIGTSPPVELNYDPVSAAWTGNRAGQDFSARIDRVLADQLAGKLSELTAQDWLQDRTDGAKALQTPQITVQVTLLSEPGDLASAKKTVTVNFAPTVSATSSPMYYGRVDAAPDIFVIAKAELLSVLGRSVMR